MDVPVQIAVRLKPLSSPDSSQSIFTDPDRQVVYTESGQTFHVNQALSIDSSQSQVFSTLVLPQVNCFIDGCDTSIIAVGQKNTGKTYMLFGNGFECGLNELDEGLIPRFITAVFHKLEDLPEREFVLYLSWIQIVYNNVHDVVGSGLIRCNNVLEMIQYLELGWTQKLLSDNHCIFTVCMEQQWVDPKGIFYHRISTASFCELASYPEPGHYSLENIIRDILAGTPLTQINYNQSTLTMLLKDSFGGRAFTWVVGCISPEPRDYQDTIKTLHLTLSCRGIINFVTINAYLDNETQVFPVMNNNLRLVTDQFINLTANAADLFRKIIVELPEADVIKINQWLLRKAECDEYLKADVYAKEMRQKNGSSKQEDVKPGAPGMSDLELTEYSKHVYKNQSKFMKYFRHKYARLIEGDEIPKQIDADDVMGEITEAHSRKFASPQFETEHRRTIRPGGSLSSADLNLLRKVAPKISSVPQADSAIDDAASNTNDSFNSNDTKDNNNDKCPFKKEMFQKIFNDIHKSQTRLKELISQCTEKEKLIAELSESTRRSSKVKCHTEKPTTKNQYDKAKSNLDMIQMKLGRDKNNKKLLQQLNYSKFIIGRYENQLYEDAKPSRCDQSIANDIKSHENSIQMYKKSIQKLKKQIKKDEKRKQKLEIELSIDKITQHKSQEVKEKKAFTVKQFTKKIVHWDAKKVKESFLEVLPSKERELLLRKEIASLRSTRECLHELRSHLACKWKIHKSLSRSDDRRLLEIEEGIEAIDTAIEYKNSLICGRILSPSLLDCSEDDGEANSNSDILLEKLDKLSHEEMKTLLCKCFRKVVDLRGACTVMESTAKAASEEVAIWRTQAVAASREEYRMKVLARNAKVVTINVSEGDDTTVEVHHYTRRSSQSPMEPTQNEVTDLAVTEWDHPAQQLRHG